MVQNAGMEYRKYIAVLREDNKSYAAAKTKRPKGKVSIEVRGDKGLLRCSVKNLAPNPGNRYNLWLVNKDNSKQGSVHIGQVKVNERGSAAGDWGFEFGKTASLGVDIDAFSLIEVRVGGTEEILSGARVLAGDLELAEVDLSGEPAMEEVAPFGNGLPAHQWWKFYPGISSDSEAEAQPVIDSVEPKLNSNLGLGPGLVHVLGGQQKKIEAAADSCFDQSNIIQTGPVFQGHHLIGLEYDEKGEVKYLIHGIPGRFCLRDQPYEGTTGYVYWHPLSGQQYKAGDYGYWLIYLRPRTGEVAFPQKAIKPPDCESCDRKEED